MTCPHCDCPDSYTDDAGVVRCSACYQHLGTAKTTKATESESPAVRTTTEPAEGEGQPEVEESTRVDEPAIEAPKPKVKRPTISTKQTKGKRT